MRSRESLLPCANVGIGGNWMIVDLDGNHIAFAEAIDKGIAR